MDAYNTLLQARQQAEYGIWRQMYFGDHLSNFEKSRRSARQLVVATAAAGKSPTLPGITIPQWYAFEQYQEAFLDNFPLQQPNATWRMKDFVRIHCNAPNYDSGSCVNTPDGGHFRGGGGDTTITMYYGTPGGSQYPGVSIRYTTDGSAPTNASKEYTAPLDLKDIVPSGSTSVHVRAKLDSNGTMAVTEASTTWSMW